ncbi:ABC-F family ATP-binding cassette domain-containing protein [Candidatus Puniceispirillum marinum]|uniref:ABC transporter related protein n=1 Tax=Puniceispirillum marinum (strain IMCC1322) TaxID=488538 RepID=D5BNA3_PUNMI|nr:ABC-F family ATP-binding cassette domain-containing protein [Candidatus Puniceispirillum marinum]ADE40296.1 ABC transporter related protein [Candidatus Puniceispirillum marinum IMCC1322]
MLKLQNLFFAIDGKPLLENASATIPAGHKVGIVGRNGTGKTSLFRLIRNEWALDSGNIEYPSYFRVGGVDQEAPASSISLLDTVLAADLERDALLREAESATDPMRIADIHMRLTDIDAHSAESRAATILAGLGFDAVAQARACAEFSGGWRMRVALGAVLFSQPDLLLLDEPTNYLDLEGAVWLETFLAKYSKTVLVISHDRGLLNRSVTGILHLTDRKLTYYGGSYDQFDAERRLKLEQQQSMKRKQDAQRAHIQSFVDRFRYKASKARQAQSRLKQLEKMQPIAALSESAVSEFQFPSPTPLPPPLMVIENASVGYDGKAVLRKIDIRLDQDDRIALLGANGEGKSTLSKLIADRLAPLEGDIQKSGKLRIGFFAQHQLDELVPGETPFQHMARLRPDELPTKLRGRLGAAGIGADIVENPVERLSGGQKARLLMAMAAIDAPHILILDEPTNHLDIESREALIHALNDYNGAVILVSHDPHLVETVADILWIVRDGAVVPFDGDMDDYRKLLLKQRSGKGKTARHDTNALKTADIDSLPPARALSGKEKRQNTAQVRSAITKTEKMLEKLTKRKADIEQEMAEPGFFETKNQSRAADAGKMLADVDEAIARGEEEWLSLQETLAIALEA